MSIVSELKKMIYNFTHPINDNNSENIEISNDQFFKLAVESGMTADNIQELQRTRNGIEFKTAKKKAINDKKTGETSKTKIKEREKDRDDKEIER